MAPKTEKTEKATPKSGDQLDLSTRDAGAPAQTPPQTSAESADASKSDAKEAAAPPPKEASKSKALKPSGVIPVFLLDDGPLGPKGAVVRVAKRKLSDLKLKKGTDWAEPTEDQLKIGG